MSCRIDLERLRTIADQVQRREKIKKRDLLEWRTLWRQKLAVVGAPKVSALLFVNENLILACSIQPASLSQNCIAPPVQPALYCCMNILCLQKSPFKS